MTFREVFQLSQLCQVAKTTAPGQGCAYTVSMSGIACEQSTTVGTMRTLLCAEQLEGNHCEHQNTAGNSFQLKY